VFVYRKTKKNAAYPSGLCAERVVLPFIQQQNFENGNHSSLIPTTTTPIPPCGSCRQSIAEYEIKQETPIEIYFMGEIGNIYKSEPFTAFYVR
jgi:cytidine deaminase